MDKRTLTTFLLVLGVLFAWMILEPMLYRKGPLPKQPARPPVQQQAAQEQPAKPQAIEPAPQQNDTEPPPAIQSTVLKNDKITLKLTNEGASVTEGYLNQYYESATDKQPQPLRLLAPIVPDQRSLAMQLDSGIDLAKRPFKVVSADDHKVQYYTRLPGSLGITKTIELQDGAYHAIVTVKLENATEKPIQTSYWLTSAAGIVPDLAEWQKKATPSLAELQSPDTQAAIGEKMPDGKTKILREGPGKPEDPKKWLPHSEATVTWAGVSNTYFSAVLMPQEKNTVASGKMSPIGTNNVSATLGSAKLAVDPGKAATQSYMFFLGPNSREVRQNPAYAAFSELHTLAWPASVTGAFQWILHAFYSLVRNYGVAIILLTIVVRLVLHPLSRKSQKSMHVMSQLGPKIKEMQAKYKDDKRRQQEETMKLYREYGANPMSGCLPLLLQLPILFGLYGALRSDIAMRQAPFFLWMKDLSLPDALMMLPASVPWAITLNVLPILMIVAMIVQQIITPKSGDAQSQQTQKMMMWMMPIMFFFIFYHTPSGLVLYFLVSTVLGVAETHIIRRQMENVALKPVKAAGKKKQTWLQRARAARMRR